jgi:hypothetical protein
MTVVYPGKDPLAPLKFMAEATRIPFELNLMEGSYMATRGQLMQVFNERLDGMYELLLGDESKLTDDRAEFVIYVEAEEADKAHAIVGYLTNG